MSNAEDPEDATQGSEGAIKEDSFAQFIAREYKRNMGIERQRERRENRHVLMAPSATLVVGVLALVGVLWTGFQQTQAVRSQLRAAAKQQEQQFAEERGRELRDLRRPEYLTFVDAANAYASAHAVRQAECQPGSDLPRAGVIKCTVRFSSDLQSARYDFQRSINRMSSVSSPSAQRAVEQIANALPPSLVGVKGEPEEGVVDEAAFSAAFVAFLTAMRCDTSPSPPTSC